MRSFLLVTVLLFLCGSVFTQNDRGAKFLGPNFFKHLGLGLDQMSDDLEIVMDQLGSSLKSIHRPFRARSPSEKLDQQIEKSLPPWLRKSSNDKNIESIEGSEDGLTINYNNHESVNVRTNGDDDVEDDESGSVSVDVQDPNGDGQKTHVVMIDRKPINSRPNNPFRQNVFSNLFKPFSLQGTFGGDSQSTYRAWYEGQNVCIDREEIDEGEPSTSNSSPNMFFFFTSQTSFCSEDDDQYQCKTTTNNRGVKKTLTVTHRCCHGYAREFSKQCEKVEDRPLSKVMNDLGASFFENLLRSSKIADVIDFENMTLFVPSNEAFEDFTAELEIQNESNNLLDLEGLDEDDNLEELLYRTKRSGDMSELVLSQCVDDIYSLNNFKDEQILQTKLEGATIRINSYAGNPPVVTANCARITTANQRATNGIIHTTDRIVHPVKKSIIETLKGNPEFTILNKLLNVEELSVILLKLESDGQYTFFAPTDDAFKNLPDSTLQAMFEGNLCLDSIIKNHILPNVICSAALGPKSRAINLLQEYLIIQRSDDDLFTVEDSKVLEKDIMTTNGVIYAIDEVLVPSDALTVLDLLSSKNLTRFLDLLETAEMLDELTKMSDITVFAPSNDAIDDLSDDELQLLTNDKESLRELLNYHISSSAMTASDISNNHMMETQSGHSIRMNLYNTYPLLMNQFRPAPVRMTAGCSRVGDMNNRACGGVVHVIEEVLSLPKKTIMETLSEDETFSIFSQILKDSKVADDLSTDGSFTVLAPSDYVFKTLPPDELDMILEDMEIKQEIAKKHVLREHLCCSGINPNTFLFMDRKRNLADGSIHVRRSPNGYLMAGPARITECGSPSSNGIIHTVNHILHNISPGNSNDQTNQRPVFMTPGFNFNLGF